MGLELRYCVSEVSLWHQYLRTTLWRICRASCLWRICTAKDSLGFEKNKKGRQNWTLLCHGTKHMFWISLSWALEHGERTLLNVARLGKMSVVYIWSRFMSDYSFLFRGCGFSRTTWEAVRFGDTSFLLQIQHLYMDNLIIWFGTSNKNWSTCNCFHFNFCY